MRNRENSVYGSCALVGSVDSHVVCLILNVRSMSERFMLHRKDYILSAKWSKEYSRLIRGQDAPILQTWRMARVLCRGCDSTKSRQ